MLATRMRMSNPVPLAEVTYVSKYNDPLNPTTISSSMSLGAADPNRKIVVAVFGGASGSDITTSSCSVAGNTATKLVEHHATATTCSFWIVDLPTGTSGTVGMSLGILLV